MKITLELGKEWVGFIKMLSGIKTSGKSAGYKAMDLSLIFLEARIKESIRKTFRKTSRLSGGKMGIAAQGRLSTDWSHHIENVFGTLVGQVGTNVKHARIHEFGGVIKPTTTQALTIPMTARAYPPAHELRDQKKTFVRNNTVFLIQPKESGKQKWKLVPIYTLKKSVNMPKRPYVAPVLAQWGPKIKELFGDAYINLLAKK